MRIGHRRNISKVAVFSLVLSVFVAALMPRNTVSARKTGQRVEPTSSSLRPFKSLEPHAEKIKQLIEAQVFSEFDAWGKQYRAGNVASGSEQLERGEHLAAGRRELLKELIKLDPAAALKQAISRETYNRLPASVTQNLEQRVSAYGDLLVYVLDEVDHSTGRIVGSRTEREVIIGNSRYPAIVYGRREAMTTKLDIPLHGIILDGMMVVDESPLLELVPAKYESRKVDVAKLGAHGIAAEVGGEVVYFFHREELDNFVRQQIEWEATIGPTRPKGYGPLSSIWTEGLKKILIMRVDFSDRPGEPVDQGNQPLTVTRAQNLINNEVSPFFQNSSYGKTSQQVTVTPVLRLPQLLAFYEQDNNYGTMIIDARDAARSAGFETNNFDLDIVGFSYSKNTPWAGLAGVGGKGAWLNGSFGAGVTAHELGHNYGLRHAHSWQTTDGSVIGQGINVEYGDSFDTMGFARASQYHFNARYKRILDWLTDANVQEVTNSGVYRVFAQDSSTAVGTRVLRIKKDAVKDYWVEFRQLFTNNQSAMNGAIVRWGYTDNGSWRTQLLDMTPATSDDTSDAPLRIGQSFYDSDNRIRMTVLGKGNTTPESLDVRVELGVGCTFSGGQTTQSFPASGGEGVITLNTQSGCRPPFSGGNDWLSVLSAEESAGSATVRYIVEANYGAQRSLTINVAGQNFTVEQSASTTPCVRAPAGLVAWWRGEGDALDQTGLHHGTLLNEMSFGGGRVGGGFKSGGELGRLAKRVLVADSPSLALTQSLTVEGWIRLSAYNAGQSNIIIRSDNNDFIGAYGVEVDSTGHITFRVRSSPTGGIASVSSTTVPLGQFVHFAGTLDNSTGAMSMYLNGSVVRQVTTAVRPYADLDPDKDAGIGIGNLPSRNASNYSLNGVIDELSVYNHALSAAEVRAIYATGTAATGSAGKCLSASDGNPGTVKFSSSNYIFNEEGGAATITVTRTGGAAAFGVDYATSNGTGNAGADYTAKSGTLNFAPDETSKTFSVPILNDTTVEANETVNLTLQSPTGGATIGTPNPAVLTIADNDTRPVLAVNDVSVTEGNAGTVAATFSVGLSTTSSQAVTVNYATANGTATAGVDYQAVSGTLTFAAGETTKPVNVVVNGDTTIELNETFTINLSGAVNADITDGQGAGTIVNDDASPTGNPIDDPTFFVTQHYRDFLNREPDQSGLSFWTSELASCGSNTQCREVKRINVSAAFFLSIEFQNTGYLVGRMYKVAYGDRTEASTGLVVPAIRRSEFMADAPLISSGIIVGQGAWEATLEANKAAYALAFVQRQRFTDIYGALGATQFVDRLNLNAGGVLTSAERTSLISEASVGTPPARASVLRKVAEHAELDRREKNRAFVLMEYFGYLRRNPDDAPEAGLNFAGWNFWLGKLNEFNGNFVQAEMVKAFLDSIEYRNRFL